MNDSPSSNGASPGNTSRPVMQPESASHSPSQNLPRASGSRPVYAGLGILALLLGGLWWHTQRELHDLRLDMATRLKSGEAVATENKVMLKSMQEGVKDLQAKVSVLEGKQTESQSQQLALEQMYQELSRTRDDWALAEIEQVLSTASQQLQLAGNVQGAVIALQNADARLASSDKPQFIVIRRAIGKDLERLRALPSVDLAGIALRMDGIINQIDQMPLLSAETPSLPAPAPRPERPARGESQQAPAAAEGWLGGVRDTWRAWSGEMWDEVRQLVRVRDVTVPDALLLSPTQSYYARENLKLRLMNARLALLTRNEGVFRNDLAAAQAAITKYFDTRARQTQSVQTQLRQVQGSNLSIEMPTLAESLNAVRNYKAKP